MAAEENATQNVKRKSGGRRRRNDVAAFGEEHPLIGKMVGNCEILEKINEGGTSLIFKAYNRSFDLPRVVKLLKPALVHEKDNYRRFIQEAQLTARLDHPNILRIYDTGEVDSQFYIEMEYVRGQTLRSYMEGHLKLDELDVLNIALQIVNALEYAHNVEIRNSDDQTIHGILHRDIKPENIMISAEKVVKLMDFGAAKPLAIDTQTMQGNIVGTPHYMSPEQINGEAMDVRSDYFSLGILMYEMLTGSRPFDAENLAALIWKIDECKFERIRKKRPAISPLSEEFVEKLLAKKPSHRFRSAKELREALERCVSAFNTWGSGRKIRVPFSLKAAFPTLSLVFSLMALGLSGLTWWQSNGGGMPMGTVRSAMLAEMQSNLKKGIEAQRKNQVSRAITLFEVIPPPEKGGDPDVYLESRLRLASLLYAERNQLTKARSVLESLRSQFKDPAIEAYLGRIYYKMALYIEAKERLEMAFDAGKHSVLQNEREFDELEFARENRYLYADALDRQYIYIEKDPDILENARQAWRYYISLAECGQDGATSSCTHARQRLSELDGLAAKVASP